MSKNISLKKASVKQLERELTKRRTNKIAELTREKDRIENKLEDLLGSTTSKDSTVVTTKQPTLKSSNRVKKSMAKARVVNEKPLKKRIPEIAADGQVRSTKEYVEALQKAGWKTSSNNPQSVVAAALAELHKENVMRRVEEGRYQISVIGV